MYGFFWFVQVLSMLCIYGGVAGVIVGIATFPAQSTKISAAVLCTITLAALYFAVCFLLWAARAMSDCQPLINASLAMSTTVRKAPMLAVLLLASRMRALNLNPPFGMPPVWMQSCFFTITALVYLEALAGAYVGATGDKRKGYYGVYLFRCPIKCAHLVLHALAICQYALLIPVIIGVVNMESAAHPGPAPLSTTLKCVISFTGIYFGVLLVQELVLFKEEYAEKSYDMLRDAAISAGISLTLAPLLCILFVATRMRALQITQQMGSPTGWAQDCMLIAVFATCVQSLCCLVMPLFIGSAAKVDEDGNPDYDKDGNFVGAMAVAIVKYVALMALHGSVVAICVSVFVMTPETANDSGRFITSKKELFKALAGTLGIFALALLFSSAKVVGMIIKAAIECPAVGKILGVNITVKKVALNLFKGYIHVSKLKVEQPQYVKDGCAMVPNVDPLTDEESAPDGSEKCDWQEDCLAKVDLLLIKINLYRLFASYGKFFELENFSIAGIHANIEKPNTDMKAKNSNVELILNKLDAMGLNDIPQVDMPVIDIPPPVIAPPQVLIGKIVLGDIGAGVCIKGVPVIGKISFHPRIGKIEFLDVQKQIFDGKDDLEPPQIVACIVSAIAKSIFNGVVVEFPRQIKNSMKKAANAGIEKMATAADGALKKIPCGAPEQ